MNPAPILLRRVHLFVGSVSGGSIVGLRTSYDDSLCSVFLVNLSLLLIASERVIESSSLIG